MSGSFTTIPTQPGTPTFTTNGPITMSFTPSIGATFYRVFYDTSTVTTSSTMITTITNTVTFTNLLVNSLYYVTIIAYNSKGAPSMVSNTASFMSPPTQPGTPTFISSTSTSISITFASFPDSISYIIYYDSETVTTSSSYVTSTTNNLTITGLSSNTTYNIMIVGYSDASIGSLPSNTASITSGPNQPGIPLFTSVTENTAFVSFDSSIGATSYNIFYDINTLTSSSSYVTTTTNSVSLTGLSSNSVYYLMVIAYNSTNGASTSSNTGTFTTIFLEGDTPPPPQPGTPTLTSMTSNSATIIFNTSRNATSYTIYYDTDIVTTNSQNTSSASNSATITSLSSNTLYNVMVVAYNSGITSIQSSSASFTTGPTQPDTPTFSNIGLNNALISFNPSIGATSYKIYYSTGSVTASSPYLKTTTNSVNITGLSNGTTYNTMVIALNSASSTSTVSTTSSFTTLPPQSGTPTFSNITSTSVSVNFTSSTGATSYKIYYDSGTVSTLSLFITTATNSGTITNLLKNTNYNIIVVGFNQSGGASIPSTSASFTTKIEQPGTPIFSSITLNSVSITFTSSNDATSYKVYYSTGTVTTSSSFISTTTNSATIGSLSGGTTYNVMVIAYNLSGNVSTQSTSCSFTTISIQPSNPSFSSITSNSVSVDFTSSTGATSYIVYYSTGTVTTSSSYVNSTTNTATINGLSGGTSYNVMVIAYNSTGPSTQSTSVSFTTTPTQPGTPTFSSITTTGVTVNFKSSNGATSYKVYYSTGTVTTSSSFISTTTNSATIGSLSGGTTYNVMVIAYNGDSNTSTQSTTALFTTIPNQPGNPYFLSITSNSVSVNFTASTGATSYIVYYDTGTVTTTSSHVNSTTNTATINGLSSNSFYNVIVIAYNSTGPSAQSTSVSFKTALTQIGTPTFSSITTTGVTVNFTSSNDSTSYTVYYSTGTVTKYSSSFISTTTNSATINSLSGGTTYNVMVIAYNALSIGSTQSSTASFTTIPSQTGTPTFSSITSSSVSINFTSTNTVTTSYKIYYDTGTVTTSSSYVNSKTNTATIYGLTLNTTYNVMVIVYNFSGTSTQSTSASFTTVPPQPGNPTLSSMTSTSLTVNFTASTGATLYKVFYSTDTVTTSSPSVTTSTTSATISGLSVGSSYGVMVVAYNSSSGPSLPSVAIPFTTGATKPGTPSFSSITETTVLVSFTSSMNAIIYKVFYSTGTVTSSSPSVTTDTNSATFVGLSGVTTYNVMVIAYISNGSASEQSSTASFTTSTSQTIARGGTITNIPGYKVHTFTDVGSNTFTSPSGITSIEVLVVGGGGGGGRYLGSGGGAGGVVYISSLVISSGNHTINVGNGGAGSNNTNLPGRNGSNSSFDSYIAYGGGYGSGNTAVYNNTNYAPSIGNGTCGSGGGEPGPTKTGLGTRGTGTTGQGHNGGYYVYSAASNGVCITTGGGGGAGGDGGNGSGSGTKGGDGGNGLSYSITGTNTYYGGGGGGSGQRTSQGSIFINGSLGGLGGGGNSSGYDFDATSGTPNTGGGGGGSNIQPSTNTITNGGDGGSGIVVIRYPYASLTTSEPGIPSFPGITSTSVWVSLTAYSDVTIYLVYYDTNTVTTSSSCVTSTSNIAIISGLSSNTVYNVMVVAYKTILASTNSTSGSFRTGPSQPGSPTLSSITSSSLSISFSSSSGATTYNVYYDTNDVGTGSPSVTTSTTTAVISDLISGFKYNVMIIAYNESGISSIQSNIDSFFTMIPKPGTPTFSSVTSNSVSVTFTSSTNAILYNIYYDTGTVTTSSSYVTNTTNSVTISNLTNNVVYNIMVVAHTWDSAYNSGSNFSQSNTASFTSGMSQPDPPTFSSITSSSVSINFTSTNTVTTSYKIYYDTGTVTSSSSYVTSTTNNTTITDLSNGTTYNVMLIAYTSVGPSAQSKTVSFITLPSQPGNPTIPSVTSNSVTVNFNSSSGAAYYKIYYDTSTVTTSSHSITSTTNSVTINGLSGGTSYNVMIVAYNSNQGASTQSTSASFKTAPTQPGTPTFSSITSSSITINFSASTGATTYKVYYDTGTVTTSSSFVTPSTNSITISSGLSGNTTYNIMVIAYDSSNNPSTQSTTVSFTTLPSQPTNLTIPSVTSNSLTVNFNSSSGAAYYKIYYDTGTVTTSSSSIRSTTVPVTINGLSGSTSYNVMIVAYNSNEGASTQSDTASFKTQVSQPGTPTFTIINISSVSVNFTSSSGATSYKIYYDTGTVTTLSSYVSTTTNSATITGLSGGTYNAMVIAYNSDGPSSPSNTVSFTMIPSQPGTVNFSSITSCSVSVSFALSTGATYYKVYYDAGIVTTSSPSVTITTTSTTITGLLGNTTYSIMVLAYNSSGASAPSSTVTFTTLMPLATGGIITDIPGYRVHTFTNVGSDTFTNYSVITNVDVLIVGGGGGGGRGMGSGGGAGGVVYRSSLAISSGNHTIQVGDGGAGSNNNVLPGNNGSNSSFDSYIAYGGGYGCGQSAVYNYSSYAPSIGNGTCGSGGGQARYGGKGTGTTGQGNNGGNFSSDGNSYYTTGGGGGAGAVGGDGVLNGNTCKGGTGGDGLSYSITGTATYYGGGGGGAGEAYSGVTLQKSLGGLGGGGNSSGYNFDATSGTPNTGGGGGGSSIQRGIGVTTNGGNGGSGIVVIRYPYSSQTGGTTFSSITSNSVLVNFASTTGATSYKVYYNTGTVDTSSPNVTNSTNSATITGLTGNTTYNVMVIAYNSLSSPISQTTTSFITGPTQPGTPSFSSVTSSSAFVTFTSSSGAVSYKIYYDANTVTSSSSFVTSTTNSATITGLTGNTNYNVMVIAYNSLENASTQSDSASFKYTLNTSGGTISDIPGYRLHTFTTVGTYTFTVSTNISNAQVLVVGGGGGGGFGGGGGGGGAGGYIYNTSYSLTAGSYTVTVGGGGDGLIVSQSGIGPAANNYGGNSVFGTLIAYGGGPGGSGNNATPPGNGGSGGGGSNFDTFGGNGTSGQGNYGGRGGVLGGCPPGSAGGGGGADGPGINVTGGRGLANNITGTYQYYAGGGGGGGVYGRVGGDGGSGGGGSSTSWKGTDGTDNTGGGGGGSGYLNITGYWNASGGKGGSGIVIIRYAYP